MSKITPKKVEMLELFYDLIFVFAISKLTAIIHHPHDGHIDIKTFIKYVIVSIVILQIWLYQTNYINRYGSATLIENALLCINMGATVYLANSINTTWESTFYPFNIAMIIMCLAVALQFALQLNKEKDSKAEILSFTTTLVLEAILIAIALCLGYEKGVYVAILAYAVGPLLPFFTTRRHLEETKTNFPHLVERMGLITIITFGEMIISITQLFSTKEFSLVPILTFSAVVLLFASYVIQMDKLVNHHQHTKGLILLYSHFGVLISLGMMTVSWSFLINAEVDRTFLVEFMVFGLVSFYASLFVNTIYNKTNKKFTTKDFSILAIILLVTIGALFIFKESNLIFTATMCLSALGVSSLTYLKLKN